jgi:hypothetical protein
MSKFQSSHYRNKTRIPWEMFAYPCGNHCSNTSSSMQTLSWSSPNLLHYVGINVDLHHQKVKSETEISQSVDWCGALQFRYIKFGQKVV